MIKEWIKDEADTLELLPICHTTKWEKFEQILDIGILSKNFSRFPDPVIKNEVQKEVIYLYYGLPFYIYETGDGININIEVTDDLPIGLIFKPESVNKCDTCYPFDTGALLTNKFKNILSCKFTELEKYYKLQISDGHELKKLTQRYYTNNENYCYGSVDFCDNCKSPKEENLLRLLNYSANSPIDLRMRAIEIHSFNDLDLKNNLLAIVLPKRRSSKYPKNLKKIETDYPSTEIVMYRDFAKGNHETFRTLIMQTVMDFYEKNFPEYLKVKI